MEGLVDWVAEALAPMAVTSRAMMGGRTLYADGVVFAILADDQLWLKADTMSDGAWDAAGCARFTYSFGDGKTGSMNYRRAPEDCYDDVDELRRWAVLALEAGRRAPAKRPRARKPKT
ncbi:TfoX/Sxy family protein [Sphingomonas sp.]|uniref:TfoX/Sxy family protein n=1 Tax=Sphingomonas sp. TaxID=28214 RepID=UPI003CC63272